MLQNQGIDIADGELLDYISESSTMSKSLEDYGERKSCATTTARRLADFLGDEMVKDKGLSCRYVVARDPQVFPFCHTPSCFDHMEFLRLSLTDACPPVDAITDACEVFFLHSPYTHCHSLLVMAVGSSESIHRTVLQKCKSCSEPISG